jgi:hypothetical protein
MGNAMHDSLRRVRAVYPQGPIKPGPSPTAPFTASSASRPRSFLLRFVEALHKSHWFHADNVSRHRAVQHAVGDPQTALKQQKEPDTQVSRDQDFMPLPLILF